MVFVRGHALFLDVLDADGAPYSLDELAAGLRAALAAAPERAQPGTSIGHLTTKARSEWAASRDALLAAGNADALDVIERALFCVCLEDTAPGDELAASDQLLHGDSGNRWFDKAISLIVFADGTAGLNSEHCRLDGTTVIAFFDAVAEGSAPLRLGPAPAERTPAVAPIPVAVTDEIRADVLAAGADFAAFAASTATSLLSIDFSAERAKALGCSPDAFAQLALQLAHQRAKGMIGATYESIATRQFRHGRTEAMRVVTPQVLAFVAAMDAGVPAAEKVVAARAAMEAHVARARECQLGTAPEQHLWELQLLQERRGGPAGRMALYDSPGWTVMRDDYLSTSAVPSPNVRRWGFGSTSQKCIGVGYAMLPDRFDMYLSTPEPVREQMLDFARELPIAVAQLEELLAT